MRSLLGKAAPAAVLLVIASLPARAQDPVTLPGVNVLARVEKPGPRMVTGIVVDTSGNVIAGAEVTIPGLARRMFTKADGTFRFEDVRPGKHSMRARKLGFAPQVREFHIDSMGGVAPFQLLPIVTALPAMVSSANKRGLSGYVANMELKSVAGANIRLLGAGLSTTTDTDGNFFIPAMPGRYMVSIEREDYTTKLVGVTVPKDSGRHMNAWLMPSTGPIPKEKFWVVEDLRERSAWIVAKDRTFYTREDLARMKIEWIYDAVQMNWSKFPRKEAYSRDCAVVVNGGPDIAFLDNLTIDDVETVEIYNTFGASTGGTGTAAGPRARGGKVKGSTFITLAAGNTRIAAIENSTRVCPGVYVWLR